MNPQRDCKEFKVETRTITEVQSEPIYPTGRCGPVLARIPVVISQSKVHIDIESRVCFDHSVFDIYSHSRNIYLTQCKLLNMGNKRYGKIYLNGYVSENIAYAAYCMKGREYGNKKSTSADMLYKTLKVPFECVAKLSTALLLCLKLQTDLYLLHCRIRKTVRRFLLFRGKALLRIGRSVNM